MKYNDCVILSETKWSRRISFVLSFFAVVFAACSDFGDRDNPLDPGADNYVAEINSSNKAPEPAEGATSSSVHSIILGSSSSDVIPASSGNLPVESSSSSKVPEPAEGSSSTSSSSSHCGGLECNSEESSSSRHCEEEAEGCDEAISSSFSSDNQSSSATAVIPTSSENLPAESSSSGKVPEPAEGTSSSTPSSSSHCEEGAEGCDEATSSSVIQSSSSAVDWTCGNPLLRDGVEYRTVSIKEQCWMQENLRYVPSEGKTMCYGGEQSNCTKYGLLYDFKAANLACPTGWRLPTSDEYEALAEYSMEGAPLYEAGAHFKATSGWTTENGDDFLEFTALPGGKCSEEQTCLNVGKLGYWWTSTENVKNMSHLVLSLNGDSDSYSAITKMDNDQFISVRCVKK